MMRNVAMVAAALTLVVLTQARSQERQPDTSVAGHIRLSEFSLDSGGAQFVIPHSLLSERPFTSSMMFFEGVPGAANGGSSRLILDAKQDLLAPLRVQWAREAQTSTFRSIMGSIQFAGVAFLAARQLTGAGIMTAKPRPVRSRSK